MFVHMITVLSLALCASALPQEKIYQYNLNDASGLFELFIWEYDRMYPDEAERQHRFEIFKENLKIINERNIENGQQAFGITQFADMSLEEFKEKTARNCLRGKDNLRTNICEQSFVTHNSSEVPEAFDWRDRRVITPARQQGGCGACWAFTTVGVVEAAHSIKNGRLINLSPQQLLDCDKVSNGCDGGQFSTAFSALKQMGGSMADAHYPYAGIVQPYCAADRSKLQAHVTGCHYLNARDEEELKVELYTRGPLAIGIASSDIRMYTGNMVLKCKDAPMDHAVLLVGYGEDNGVPFWVIKNSWGENFGDKGFIKIIRGINACGILNEPAYSAVVA